MEISAIFDCSDLDPKVARKVEDFFVSAGGNRQIVYQVEGDDVSAIVGLALTADPEDRTIFARADIIDGMLSNEQKQKVLQEIKEHAEAIIEAHNTGEPVRLELGWM